MKKVLVIGGVATLVVILGVATLGAVAFAQDGEDGPFNFRERFNDVVAGILGIPVSDYEEALTEAQEQVLGEAVDKGWLTEEQQERMQKRFEDGAGPGRMDPRGMFPGGGAPEGGFKGRGMRGMPLGPMEAADGGPIAAAAKALDMTLEELQAEMQDGKSIAALAEEKGVELDTIADAYVEQMSDHLAQAVTDGKITQEQADQMVETAKKRILGMLDHTWPEGGFHDFRKGGRPDWPGRFEDLPGQDDA